MGREEEIVKERREKKRVEKLRQAIVDFADTILAMYILLSGMIIAYCSVILLYNGHRNEFLELLVFNDGTVIGDFFVLGFGVAGICIGCGLISIQMWKSKHDLERRGYKKRIGLLNHIMTFKEKERKERDRDV